MEIMVRRGEGGGGTNLVTGCLQPLVPALAGSD